MMTIGEAERKLYDDIQHIYDADEAKAIAQLALSHICGISKVQLAIRKNDLLDDSKENEVGVILAGLLRGKPVQYILGETEFFGLPIKVTPAVLIPRPETEELVEWILEESKKIKNEDSKNNEHTLFRILDIGTGSGCIPIALKKHLTDAEAFGMDVSPEALEIAKENAMLNDVNIRFFYGDILLPHKQHPSTHYNIIISNPPYITMAEKNKIHENVLDHEPHTALFVPDDNPLLFYKAIADFALVHLTSDGLLFLEINEFLGDITVSMLHSKGFKNVILRKDLQGKNRMIKATF
ncbi:MAG TPA: peptide chain release factor N(5)-glutamine methyltransferase [Sphingobacteriaceae bacterium]